MPLPLSVTVTMHPLSVIVKPTFIMPPLVSAFLAFSIRLTSSEPKKSVSSIQNPGSQSQVSVICSFASTGFKWATRLVIISAAQALVRVNDSCSDTKISSSFNDRRSNRFLLPHIQLTFSQDAHFHYLLPDAGAHSHNFH